MTVSTLQPAFPQSLPLSLPDLLTELEHFIRAEHQENATPWVEITRFVEKLRSQHGISAEDMVKAQGYYGGLRDFLCNSGRFAIYGTPRPRQFYLALPESVVPTPGSQ